MGTNHTPSLYISPPKTNKNKALFFVTSLKEKKASFKNLCHSIPKRFNLNTTLPLYSTPYGTGKLELFVVLQYLCSKRYLPCFLLYVLYFFQLKLSMFQLPSPVTKLFFFLLALVK